MPSRNELLFFLIGQDPECMRWTKPYHHTKSAPDDEMSTRLCFGTAPCREGDF